MRPIGQGVQGYQMNKFTGYSVNQAADIARLKKAGSMLAKIG